MWCLRSSVYSPANCWDRSQWSSLGFTVYVRGVIHNMERGRDTETSPGCRTLFTGSMHRMRARKSTKLHTHGFVKCVTLSCLLQFSLWRDKEGGWRRERCTGPVLWTNVFLICHYQKSSVGQTSAQQHHGGTHGRKYTLKCYDEGANMPQTDCG